MSVRSAQSVTVEFTTSNPSTQAAANADSTPAGTLVVNGTDNAASVTVTNVDAGRYKAAVTLPTLAVGDIVELSIAATVSAIAGKAIVWRDTKDVVIDAAGLADANVVKVGPTGSGTAQTAKDLGLALPAFAAGAAGGLVISGTNTGPLSISGGVTFSNSGGSAFTLSSSGGNGHGLRATGNGSGAGFSITAGTTGIGLDVKGGATSGDGASFGAQLLGHGLSVGGVGSAKHGLYASTTGAGGSGIAAVGQTTGAGLLATGGATGYGVYAQGGATSGAGIRAEATAGNSDGADFVANGSGVGFNCGTATFDLTGSVSGSVGNVTTKTGYALTAAYDAAKTAAQAGDAMILTAGYDFAKGTAAMTESYAANGVAPTPAQALYAIQQMLTMFAISGTSYTVKKLDGSATAFVVTLDSATSPTAATRS